LKDSQIQQNAVTAGWDKTLVEEAFVIVRYLGTNAGTAGETPGKPARGAVPDGYRIGSGDVLQIAVWKEPEVSVPTVVVRADGKISVPLIKDVDVLGLAPVELEKLLTERLAKFINAADVTVVVKEINSWKVYMVGALKKESPLPLRGQMTVLQAINEAGGLTDYAKRKNIYILRTENGRQTRLPFDYEAVIAGKHMEQNIQLRPDDMIVVPQ
jgi:polysaccharide export outer membrane protein